MKIQLIPDDHKWEIVEFDLTMTETHMGEGELTDNPVEDATSVADHLVRPPQKFQCQVAITNAPMGPTLDGQGATPQPVGLLYPPSVPRPQLALSLFGVSLSLDLGATPATLPATVLGLGMPQNWDRIRRHLELLERMRDHVVKMSVATLRRYYTDMVLETISHNVEGPITVGVFDLSFKRLRVVQTLVVDAPQPKEARGANNKAKGSQATDDGTFGNDGDHDPFKAKDDKVDKSLVKQLIGYLPK